MQESVPGRRERLRDVDLITRDLAGKPGVVSALVAATGSNGGATVLSAAGAFGRSEPRAFDFVSRAVRAQRQMVETLDPIQDWSFGGPTPFEKAMFAVSFPVGASQRRSVALCAAVSGPWPGSDPQVLEMVKSYAQLVALRPAPLSGGRFSRADRDPATGCLSYVGLVESLRREIDRCGRLQLTLTTAFVDVHRVTRGPVPHSLAEVGRALRETVGAAGTVGRYGGERFVLVFPEASIEVAPDLTEEVEMALAGVDLDLGACFGWAEWVPGTGVECLLGEADIALTTAMRYQPQAERTTG
jgi:GGDEF domain-containing protein